MRNSALMLAVALAMTGSATDSVGHIGTFGGGYQPNKRRGEREKKNKAGTKLARKASKGRLGLATLR